MSRHLLRRSSAVCTPSTSIRVRLFRLAVTGAAAVLVFAGTAAFAEAADIVRVEEDWVLEIGTPDTNDEAPQIVSVISPVGNIDTSHAVFELNHATQPDYSAGGMQLQRWWGGDIWGNHNHPNASLMHTENESVTYTMAMSVVNDHITYEVTNGNSTTWGTFGGQGYLKTTTFSTWYNLNAYSPSTSVTHSRIGYASHRVKKFCLKEVRYYSAAGLVSTDTTERVVFEHSGEE